MLNDVIIIGKIIKAKKNEEGMLINIVTTDNNEIKDIWIPNKLLQNINIAKNKMVGMQGSLIYQENRGNIIDVERIEIFKSKNNK